MKASIIKIGNSRGLRIPKALLLESGLGNEVELHAQSGKITIMPLKPTKKPAPQANDEALLSESAFSDWLRPEEEEAWKVYQADK